MDFTRKPNYDVRNDGGGVYAIFYCDQCQREFRSQPELGNMIKQDIGKAALGGFLRKIPLVGHDVANQVTGDDPRYSMTMSSEQVEKAWEQVKMHFRECPTCHRIVCLSDFDSVSGFCQEDSPRGDQIAQARAEQAGAAVKGFSDALGLTGIFSVAAESAKRVEAGLAVCPSCDTKAAAGTKFCPDCGTAMQQPQLAKCPKCGASTGGAKFCPECGTKAV